MADDPEVEPLFAGASATIESVPARLARGQIAIGQVRTYLRADGPTTYSLRFRALGQRWVLRLGTEEEGWTEARAKRELAKQVALVDAGVWEPPRIGHAESDRELSVPRARDAVAPGQGA